MSTKDTADRFMAASPFAVMTRVLAQTFMGSHLDEMFEEHRGQQYERQVKFSALAIAVADVALQFSDNFNQAYKSHQKDLNVSLQSFYDKINGTDTQLSEAVVARSALPVIALQDQLGFEPWEVIPGYRCFSIDGNVLAKSDKRLGVLRDVKGAPLPGKAVARFDLQRQIFDRVYLLADGHAQESTTCESILEDLLENDVIIADRHYCVLSFFAGIANRKAAFVIRQHGRLKGVLLGKRRCLGRIETGVVYEQALQVSQSPDAMVVRRITVELDEPTRDGDTEIHILTNLPTSVNAKTIANAYRHRWEEETAFNILQMTLTCELSQVGHPNAALLLFCLSMLAFNLRQVLFACLFAVHSLEDVEAVSHFHLSKEVSNHTPGMLVAISAEEWDELIPATIAGVAKLLKAIASQIDIKKYRKAKRGPKKKKPHRSRNVASSHVSTAKLLNLV